MQDNHENGTHHDGAHPDDSDDDKLDRFKLDIIKDADALSENRDKDNEDMRFINVSGGMWEGFNEEQFTDRTKLEFDTVSDYKNRFIGEWNQNRLGVEFKPNVGTKTTDDDAELLNGIYRADFRQNSGKMSVDNAVDEAVTCGYGCFKLATRMEDEEDPENKNQVIEWRPIHTAYNAVFWDNSAKRIDKRDARRCTELKLFTRDSFLAEYPGKSPVSAYNPLDRRFLNFQSGGTQPQVYVAKRYEIVRKKEITFVYNNLATGEIEEYNEEDHELIKGDLKSNEFIDFVEERKHIVQFVEMTVFSGEEILEEPRRIAGKWIPIIPIYAYRAYVDGVEWHYGLVRKLMDAARLFNMQISQLAENSASSGQEVPIFDPDQMKGDIPSLWADKNNKPYLLAKALRNEDGTIVQHGPTGYVKPPQLDGSTAALLQLVPNFIQSMTGGVPQDTIDPNMSGKALNALIKRENLNTQTINDHIASSVEWSGTVYESMASEIYTKPRIVNTIGLDGTESSKQLLKQVFDEETGRIIETNNLNKKKFRVYADVGPQYDTLREQTVEELKGMAEILGQTQAGAQYMPAIIAMIMENTTGVGLAPLKKLVRQDMILQGLVDPETDEEQQLLANAQQEAQQPDPQQQLVEAAAAQAEGEGRERESKVLDNAAAANLKAAQTEKVLNDIRVDQAGVQNDRVKTLADIRNQVFQNAQRGTLQ